MQFFAAEIHAYRPGTAAGVAPALDAYGAIPFAAIEQLPAPPESYDVIRASDAGYRSLATDSAGVQVFPPFLTQAFAWTRKINLSPTKSAAGAAWGNLVLANSDDRYTALASADNVDGRDVVVFAGRKTFDPVRGIHVDPSFAAMSVALKAIGQGWFADDKTLTIALRDPSYWLERPVQQVLYGGTGGLDGGANLKGLPKPMTRGTCRNVSPVLVDATNRIYQWTDGPGSITSVYEGGVPFAYSGDVTSLSSGGASPGSYRSNNAAGLFQLGSSPVHAITADVSGAGGTTAVQLLQSLLLTDLALPAGMLDAASFATADAACPYPAGYFVGAQAIQGADLMATLANSIGANIVPFRAGTLGLFLLRTLAATAAPVATLTPFNAVSLTPQQLGAPLDPPPWRWQVQYGRCWTVQTDDFNGAVSDDFKTFAAVQDRTAVEASSTVKLSYLKPSDPDQVETYLANQADADALAGALVALWGVRRRSYDVVVPVGIGLSLEIGSVVALSGWRVDDLAGGRVGQVVGEQFQAPGATLTVSVLV